MRPSEREANDFILPILFFLLPGPANTPAMDSGYILTFLGWKFRAIIADENNLPLNASCWFGEISQNNTDDDSLPLILHI